MTENESKIESLKLKMDTLGQMMYDWEAKQSQFDEEDREELKEIAVRKEELRDEVIRLGMGVESEKLKIKYRKGMGGQPLVAFVLKDDEPIWLASQQASW